MTERLVKLALTAIAAAVMLCVLDWGGAPRWIAFMFTYAAARYEWSRI